MGAETERIRRIYDRAARRYDAIMLSEKLFFGDGRAWVCARASGDALEIAIGTGRNLLFYPPDIRLTGIELSPAMLAIARERAKQLGRTVDLRPGDAQSLDFPDETFDTVVITLALCTIPDDHQAAREAYRVLRPGGRLLLMEHVRSPNLPVRLVEYILNPLMLRQLSDHLLRDPIDYLEAEGFQIEELRRSRLGLVECVEARKVAGTRSGRNEG